MFGFIPEKASHLFQWSQLIIMRNMPIHEVEDELTRAMSKRQLVTVKAVKKCMERIAIKIGKKLEVELGEHFGLMFDGWSNAGVDYVAIFAVNEADVEFRVPLIGLSPCRRGSEARTRTRCLCLSVRRRARGGQGGGDDPSSIFGERRGDRADQFERQGYASQDRCAACSVLLWFA
jgi:hypothetical protein